MKHRTTAISAALGLGLALGLGAMPAQAATPDDGGTAKTSTHTVRSGYIGESSKATEAFFNAVVKDALKKQAAKPGFQAVTVNYDASGAPKFASQIANSTAVWNAAVKNVASSSVGMSTSSIRWQ